MTLRSFLNYSNSNYSLGNDKSLSKPFLDVDPSTSEDDEDENNREIKNSESSEELFISSKSSSSSSSLPVSVSSPRSNNKFIEEEDLPIISQSYLSTPLFSPPNTFIFNRHERRESKEVTSGSVAIEMPQDNNKNGRRRVKIKERIRRTAESGLKDLNFGNKENIDCCFLQFLVEIFDDIRMFFLKKLSRDNNDLKDE